MFYALGSVQVSATPYLLTIMVALAFCFITIAAVMLLDSDADNMLVRATQGLRLHRTRMPRMLRRRGIGIAAYMGGLTVPQLKEQIATCKTCGQAQLCDRALESRITGNSHSHFTFCPNRAGIEHHRSYRAAQQPG